MLYRVQSKKSLAAVAEGLAAAAQRHKFGVLMIHDLKAKLKEKGVDFDRDCLIYEVCNPQQAKKVLESNAEISTALPCRISIYPEGAGVTLATLRPTAMIELYQARGLEQVAREVEAAILQMMNEAAH
jgi:uncharacterized protein (DUF302 family)